MVKKHTRYIIVLLIILTFISIGAITSLYSDFEKTRQENRQAHLEQNLQKAVIEFDKGVDKFAVLVLGIRSHILETDVMLSAQEMQRYINNYVVHTEYLHSFIINYFSPNHTFLFSISEKELVVNELVGLNILDIRDTTTTSRMDRVLASEGLVSEPPINLIEGFVGFPIDFRIELDGEIIGYLTPLIDIKNIIDPIINNDVREEFTYRFSYVRDEEVLFDRERVYNGTKFHHSRVDSTNLHLPKEDYLIAETEAYGVKFNIGIAYRAQKERGLLATFFRTNIATLLSFIVSFLLISAFLLYLFVQNLNRRQELRKSNMELFHMNDILKKFIYASSHDLKQPLVNINNFQSLLKRKYASLIDKAGNKYLDVISQNIQYMEDVLNDLLIYSRVIRGEKKKQQVDLNEVLSKINETHDFDGFDLNYQDLPPVYGVSTEIHRLFRNLISNGVKFNENEIARIEITAETYKDEIEIRISDNGIGIADEHLGLIFEEFQRLDKKKYKGTGLGLSICKEIVNNHGGTIWAERNQQGGTDLVFQLRHGA